MADELLRALGRRERAPVESPMSSHAETHDAISRPFDTGEREALLDSVMARLSDGAASKTDEPPAPVVEIASARKRSGTTIVVAGVLALIAASLVLWLSTQPPSGPVDALPHYAFTLARGGDASMRSAPEPDEELELHANDPIEFVVTPDEPHRSAIAVALLAEPVGGHGTLVPVTADATISPSGAVRLEGPLDRFVELAPGSWNLAVIVAPEGALPKDAEEARGPSDGRWQRAELRVMILPP
jgi:hypothetical protein